MAPHDLEGESCSRGTYNFYFREPAEDLGSMLFWNIDNHLQYWSYVNGRNLISVELGIMVDCICDRASKCNGGSFCKDDYS